MTTLEVYIDGWDIDQVLRQFLLLLELLFLIEACHIVFWRMFEITIFGLRAGSDRFRNCCEILFLSKIAFRIGGSFQR